MADFKIEIIFDGDAAEINAFDLTEKVKTNFTEKEIKDIETLSILVSKARALKNAFILSVSNDRQYMASVELAQEIIKGNTP